MRFSFTSKERILYVNKAGMYLGANKKEEILGQSIYRVIHPNYQEIARERLEQIREKHSGNK